MSAYPPAHNDVFDVVTAGTTRTGTFATVVGDGFDVTHLADRVRVTPPTLNIGNRTVTEGDTGTVNALLHGHPLVAERGHVEVDYATADDTAVQPGDYTSTSGTATFAPGQTTRTINVPVKGDLVDETNEKFNVNLDSSDPRFANVADGTGVGTITDNDPPPSVSISDSPNRSEGDTASSFDVTLSAASEKQVKVNYATAPGTATSPADYTAISGTLTFAPGVTSLPLSVSSVEDALDENNETFTVDLSTPVNVTLGDASGSATITDDDPTPSVSISNSPNRTEGGAASELRRHALGPERQAGDGQLRDRPRHRDLARRLHGDQRHADLRSRRDQHAGHRLLGRRRARRDRRGVHGRPLNSDQRDARRRQRERDAHRQRPDALAHDRRLSAPQRGRPPASRLEVTLSAPSGQAGDGRLHDAGPDRGRARRLHDRQRHADPSRPTQSGQVRVRQLGRRRGSPSPPSEKSGVASRPITAATIADDIGIARILDDD